jgi:vacuolar-type H+-ATPase subunit B/Vma2
MKSAIGAKHTRDDHSEVSNQMVQNECNVVYTNNEYRLEDSMQIMPLEEMYKQ